MDRWKFEFSPTRIEWTRTNRRLAQRPRCPKGVKDMRGGRIWYRRRVPAVVGEQSVGATGGEARAAHRPPAARLYLLAKENWAAAGHGGGWGSAVAYSGG